MEVWNYSAGEAGKAFVVRFTDTEQARIQKARKYFMNSPYRQSMSKESVTAVKSNVGQFLSNRVFCYEDENGVMQNEVVVNDEVVADTRDVLFLHAKNSRLDERANIDLASQLLAGAVNSIKEVKRNRPVESADELSALILGK